MVAPALLYCANWTSTEVVAEAVRLNAAPVSISKRPVPV